MVHALSQKHFHNNKSISVPFKNSCKNGLRLLVIKSSFWGRHSLYSKCEKKLPSVWSKLKREGASFEKTVCCQLISIEMIDCASGQLHISNTGLNV